MTEEKTAIAAIPTGFKTLKNSAQAELHAGPFYYKKTDDDLILGFRAQDRHSNAIGTVHGGILLFFADYAVIMIAMRGQKESCTTVSCSNHFVAAARSGEWVEAEGAITRRTGSLVFVTGRIFVETRTVLTFQSVVKRIHPQ